MRLPLALLGSAVVATLALGSTGCVIVDKGPAAHPQAAPGTVLYENYSVPIIKGSNAFGSGSGSLRGILFFIGQTTRFPDLKGVTPSGAVYVNNFDIPKQPFAGGFAGITDRSSWFAIRYEGHFEVGTAGNYGFDLVSDDGANLYIDGNLVVSNDGAHPSTSAAGTVNLGAGKHKIRVDYFQGTGDVELRLLVTPPGGSKRSWAAKM